MNLKITSTSCSRRQKLLLLNKSLDDTWTKILEVMADLAVVAKAYFEMIAQNCLSKLTSSLQLQIVMTVESTFEYTLHESYFNSKNGLEPAMLKVVE